MAWFVNILIVRVRMSGLLASCLDQVDIIHRHIVRVRYRHFIIMFSVIINNLHRFQDKKISSGRLKFFVHLCRKLKVDIDQFVAILQDKSMEVSSRQSEVSTVCSNPAG